MVKITKASLDELAQQLPLLTEMEQASCLGGTHSAYSSLGTAQKDQENQAIAGLEQSVFSTQIGDTNQNMVGGLTDFTTLAKHENGGGIIPSHSGFIGDSGFIDGSGYVNNPGGSNNPSLNNNSSYVGSSGHYGNSGSFGGSGVYDGSGSSGSGSSQPDYTPPYNSLSPAEKAFIWKNPVTALKFKNNAQTASEFIKGLEGRHNGYADALRHCCWSALNQMTVGQNSKLAEEYGNAHESSPTNPKAEKEMDLKNNAVGYSLGKQALKEGWSQERLFEEIKKAAQSGQLQLGL